MDIIKKAHNFAHIAHAEIGQTRKYTNEPYIVHPEKVAYIIKMIGGSEDMICAAYLHDVLEDVSIKHDAFGEDEIEYEFGKNVLELVKWVTDVSKKEDGNREKRKFKDIDHLSKAPAKAQTIKLADIIDNSINIVEYDLNFSKIYLKEKRLLLSVLHRGNKNLWNIANDILLKYGY